MRHLTESDLVTGLEEGYKLAPIPTQENGVGPHICVVIRSSFDPAGGHFVLLRDTPHARVVLGCLADSAGTIHEWLELWVQNTGISDLTDPAYRERLTNTTWDAAWREIATILRQSDSAVLIATPLETGHLPPSILHPAEGYFTALVLPERGELLTLCCDDRLLESAGLPSYGSSLHRYLYAPDVEGQEEMKFVRIRHDSPSSERTVELDSLLPGEVDLPALSLAGAGLIARKFAPLGLEDFAELAGGSGWRGIENARRAFHVPGVYRLLEDADAIRHGSGHLFSSAGGRSARLAESLYLKLQVFSQVCRLAREHVRFRQMPLLNVSAESFRVRLGATGFGLPFLWTARAELVLPGQAYSLPLGQTAARYFRSLTPLTDSIYRPGFVGIAQEGVAHMRVVRVFEPAEGGLAMEGTLRTADRLTNSPDDLLILHLPLVAGRIELYGHVEVALGLSRGEAVFRTIPQPFSAQLAAAMRANVGVPRNGIGFSIQSPLSTPFDLYSLGVLALRLLMVDANNSLQEALDAAFSLADQARHFAGDVERLNERLAVLFAEDPRWREKLGTQHALFDEGEVTALSGPADLPERLWLEVLALLLRFFPALLPESFCQGYGDAPSLALETVFDAPIQELDALLVRYRAFLLGGWRQNLEITRIIQAVSQEFG